MATQQLPFYQKGVDEVLRELYTNRDGLNPRQAADRLKHDGPNQLSVKRRESPLMGYLRQYKDPMIALLIASALISFYLEDVRVAVVLLALTLFNTAIGFFQEYRAERLLQSLENLVVPTARVRRSGALQEVASTELVVGDIVYIEEGNSVPADMRIIEATELSTNDFAMTGESNPSHKYTRAIMGNVPLGNRHNLVFMGTTVATGNGFGVVIGVGEHTELGRIANLSHGTKRETSPLQKEMGTIAKRVTQGTLLLCAILMPIAMAGGLDVKEALLFAIAVAASIIPQGLPAEISTALAQAANKLSARGALVKKLSAVETLGATTIICTDKTGTLTKNQMTVEKIFVGKNEYGVSGTGYAPEGAILDGNKDPLSTEDLESLELFFETGFFAGNATISPPDVEHPVYYAMGDPTEAALVTLAKKAGLDTELLDKTHVEVREFTFDSARKRMSSVRSYGKGTAKQLYVFTKGAPEEVLAQCTDIWDHGHTRGMTAADLKRIRGQVATQATGAMRNLAFAYRVLPGKTDYKKLEVDDVETKLTWLGMVSMIDPLRPEVPAAMEAARLAHVNVAIITGDHAITAAAIAERAGLTLHDGDTVVLDGEKLSDLSDQEVTKLIKRGGIVFSRVAPEDKLRIVSLAQKAGQVVAVTGDGINDAPALKRADIGVAMGKTGTDVAKDSAEIVLLDDSFGTLVNAISQGRTIFQNIKKATLSCFTSNAAELVVSLAGLIAFNVWHIPLALSVMQILAIDLIAELFPIAALGNDKADGELMREKPRRLSDHILNRSAIFDLVWCGILIGGLAYANYILFYGRSGISPDAAPGGPLLHMQAMSLTYLTIVLCQLANILMRRSRHGLFTRYQFQNRNLWGAIAFSVMAVIIIIYVPFMQKYFMTGALGLTDWLFALGATAIFIAIREFQRYDRQHHRNHVIAAHHQRQTA